VRTYRTLFPLLLLASIALAQHADRLDRERAQVMLQEVANDVRTHYYDPKLHGVDWDARVRDAKQKIAGAGSSGELPLQIAALFESLNDSHTAFYPPRDPIAPEYGFRFQPIGNRCFVTQVRPRSDAEARGLRPGDEILSINDFSATRESLDNMLYVVNVLLPQSRLHLELRDPTGHVRHADVAIEIRQAHMADLDDMTGRDAQRLRLESEDHQRRNRVGEMQYGNDLLVIKFPQFTAANADALSGDLRAAHDVRTVILDLRGNPGGEETALQATLANFFDHEVPLATRVTRTGEKKLTVAGSRQNGYAGKLIVLVDSHSASAAELFARVIQLEKRGTVLGDRTSGSVMEAEYFDHTTGINPVFHYGAMVSIADLIMSDGKSLEHTGVLPDQLIVPSPDDLAANRDPVLARATELANVNLTPEAAAKLFPFEWPMR